MSTDEVPLYEMEASRCRFSSDTNEEIPIYCPFELKSGKYAWVNE